MTTTAVAPIGFYYGSGKLDRLQNYSRVVLQPGSFSTRELSHLRQHGVQTLAYLSLSEDEGPEASWQRPERNPDWGGALVHVGDPRWVDHIVTMRKNALESGFDGLFLDQPNVEFTFPQDIPHLLALIERLRLVVGDRYLMANRGLAMLPRLAAIVDGILFESFSVPWTATGSAAWPSDVLDIHDQTAEQLLDHNIDLFALDYATTDDLIEFARRRATPIRHGSVHQQSGTVDDLVLQITHGRKCGRYRKLGPNESSPISSLPRSE